jgi:hypothetical protein
MRVRRAVLSSAALLAIAFASAPSEPMGHQLFRTRFLAAIRNIWKARH